MTEYIDREAIIKAIEFNKGVGCSDYCAQGIKYIPAADVVEVVRCKDCQRARHWKDGLTCPRMEYITKDGVVARTVSENAFCCWGISKEDKA